jgi:serine/threonine protein kinase/Tfp pilus assembly protein PilF
MTPQEHLPKDAAAAADAGLAPTVSMDGADTTARVIGRYHLVRSLGEGGMGEVWLAEQKEPVRRRVALKLVKGGLNTRETIARFNSERQALALMDHPAIAKVFDADATLTGAPYFVMEYVAGTPITDYCDHHRLSTRERVELFAHVCDGVQHAHQKAIIHRDLKPSNILVTEVDGKAAPKIIDFGVAKALTQSLGGETMFTRAGGFVGTPGYISPEQASSSGEDIDTRTDVYALGVNFYELLAGAPPLDLGKLGLEEFLRKLREDEPSKPSTKISTQDRVTSTEVANHRQTEPLALARQLRGELDSIAMKALEKERSRRYSSASEFAADIRRYLNNEPVLAVPPSLAYRARKFASRYSMALAIACAFALVLIVASVASIRQNIRANREAAMAQAVNDFLQHDLLSQASVSHQSGEKLDPDIKVRTALDRAAAGIEGKFRQQPEVEAAIRTTIGQTYMQLGQYPEAQKQLERVLDMLRKTRGEKDRETVQAAAELGEATRLEGRYAEAEALLAPALEFQRRVLGRENRQTLQTMSDLALAYDEEGKSAQAEPLAATVVEIQRRVLGPEHPGTLFSMNRLAVIYTDEGKLAQAEALDSQTLEIRRRVIGPERPATLDSMGNLANVYDGEGKYAQSVELHSQEVEISRRVWGPEHPHTLLAMNNLACALADEGRFAEAETILDQALEIQRRVLGPEHPQTLLSAHNLGWVYILEGRYGLAEPLVTQTLEIRRRVLGPDHSLTLSTLGNLAYLYQRQGNYPKAESIASQVLAIDRRLANESDTAAAAVDLALAYESLGKFTEAEPLAREAFTSDQKARPDDWQTFRAESVLGASLVGQKKFNQAEPLLVEGYHGMEARKPQMGAGNWYHLDFAHAWIAQMYRSWGKPDKAAEWKK